MSDNNQIETCNPEYLTADIMQSLCQYQISHLNREINDFLVLNRASDQCLFTTCPKCHESVDHFKRGGYTYAVDCNGSRVRKEVLLKCPICGHRFTTGYGQLVFYSHASEGVWIKVIKDTISGVPIAETAAEINRHVSTVFRMRHKFLSFIELLNEETSISKPCEADEKYINECHKGLVEAVVNDKQRTVTIKKKEKTMKGISHQKVCMETIIERQGVSYAEAINTSRPLKDKLLKACSHIEPGTYVWTDDNQGYVNVLKELGCPHKELKSGTSINQIDHLNTVNNLHSQIDEKIRRYRNVSSIYINRYVALFTLQQKCIGMDLQEIALKVVQWLRKRTQFFRVSDMRRKIFDDPCIMAVRSRCLPWRTIRSYKMAGYAIIHER